MVLFKNRTTEAINSSAKFINLVHCLGLWAHKTQTEYSEYLDLCKNFKEENKGNLSTKGLIILDYLIRIINDIVNDNTKDNQLSKDITEKLQIFCNIVDNDYSDMTEEMNITNYYDYLAFDLFFSNLPNEVVRTKENIKQFREELLDLYDLLCCYLTPKGFEIIKEILRCTNVVIDDSNKLHKFRARLYEIISTFRILLEEDLL